MRMGDRSAEAIDTVSTGSLGLDVALGVGGLPRGRVVEIYGPESSGKTTLTLQVIASCQKNGGTAAFVDAEHALDPSYAAKLGVNVDDLLVSQPDTPLSPPGTSSAMRPGRTTTVPMRRRPFRPARRR